MHGTMPYGIGAEFAKSPTNGNSSALLFTVGPRTESGVYELFVYGSASTGWYCCETILLIVTK